MHSWKKLPILWVCYLCCEYRHMIAKERRILYWPTKMINNLLVKVGQLSNLVRSFQVFLASTEREPCRSNNVRPTLPNELSNLTHQDTVSRQLSNNCTLYRRRRPLSWLPCPQARPQTIRLSHRLEADIYVQHHSYFLRGRWWWRCSNIRVWRRGWIGLQNGANNKEQGAHSI